MKLNEKRNFWENAFSIKPIDFYVAQIGIIFLLILSIGFIFTVNNLDERLKKMEMNNNFNTIINFDNINTNLSTNNGSYIITKVENILYLTEYNKYNIFS